MTTGDLSLHPGNFANLKCPPSTLICIEKTTILGDVTIGEDCVIHPTVTIIAEKGPIIIGSQNLFEERVKIINKSERPMMIGDNNFFEVDSHSEATHIGDDNILESKSKVGSHIQLSNNCIIGAGCNLLDQNLDFKSKQQLEVFESNTVISGSNMRRERNPTLPPDSHSSQLDFLRKILPNYQKLWRPANLPHTPQQMRSRVA